MAVADRDRIATNGHRAAPKRGARAAGQPPMTRPRSSGSAADPVARDPDDPRGEPRPPESRWPEGRRPPGVVAPRWSRSSPRSTCAGCAPGTSSPSSRTRRPRTTRCSTCWASLDRAADRSSGRSAASSRTHQPDEGPRPDRLLDRLRRAGRRRADVRGRSPTATCATHFRETVGAPERRFVATVGDAELDEGNVWEAILEDALRGLGNVTVVVDLNRQSLDRVVPGIRIRRARGDVRRRRLACPRGEVRAPAPGARSRGPGGARSSGASTTCTTRSTRSSSGAPARRPASGSSRAAGRRDPRRPRPGARRHHRRRPAGPPRRPRRPRPRRARAGPPGRRSRRDRPSIVFAYTDQGLAPAVRGRPPEPLGDAHRASRSRRWRRPWAPSRRPVGRLRRPTPRRVVCCQAPRSTCGYTTPTARAAARPGRAVPTAAGRAASRPAPAPSRRSATCWRRSARDPDIGERIVTAAPDVAVSTNLGGWINRAGVFSAHDATAYDDTRGRSSGSPARPAGTSSWASAR